MALTEFELIDRYFKRDIGKDSVILGVGDDCALLEPPAGEALAVTTDTLIGGIHFFNDANPRDIGYKALAVSVSDLAAMGAMPLWFTLSLSMPTVDESFLESFSHGLYEAAREYHIDLVGGDTTKGPLSIGITAMGCVPTGQVLKRKGAMIGDKIYVSGYLGEAFVGLQQALDNLKLSTADYEKAAYHRLMRPTARVELGMALRNKASSAIDISDGLLADLNHILKASKVGAMLNLDAFLISDVFEGIDKEKALDAIMRGGDDYELCFTISPLFEQELKQLSTKLNVPLTCVGKVVEKPGITIFGLADDKVEELVSLGFKHF